MYFYENSGLYICYTGCNEPYIDVFELYKKVAKIQKLYSNLQDAFGRATAIYGPMDEWFATDTTAVAQTTRFGERLTEFMKVSKNCKMEANKGCGPSTLDASTSNYKFITADGTYVDIAKNGSSNQFLVAIDIAKSNSGNHILTQQIFVFLANNDGLGVQSYDGQESRCLETRPNGSNPNPLMSGFLCTAWVVNFGNMDYLKTDKAGKCPNGRVLNATVTSCK